MNVFLTHSTHYLTEMFSNICTYVCTGLAQGAQTPKGVPILKESAIYSILRVYKLVDNNFHKYYLFTNIIYSSSLLRETVLLFNIFYFSKIDTHEQQYYDT